MVDGSRSSNRWHNRPTCTQCEVWHDPLRAGVRQRARLRKLVPELVRLRKTGQGGPDRLSSLQLDQGRKDHHGSWCRGSEKERQGAATGAARCAPPVLRGAVPPAGGVACRDDLTAGARVSQETEGAARSSHKKRRLCRPKISRKSRQRCITGRRSPVEFRARPLPISPKS